MDKKIEKAVTEATDVNVHYYTDNIIERCVNRRKIALGIDDIDEYVERLKDDEEEKEKLHENLTINVTKFFRSEDFWEKMKEVVDERFGERRNLEVWSAGCSKGHEPYTLAIIFDELDIDATILATDISSDVIEYAKKGVYRKKSMENVSEERKDKYFERTNEGWEVDEKIKEKVKFREHDVISGKIIGGFDVITCRNTIKFFEKAIQETVFINIHKSLKKDGVFGLGAAESMHKQFKGELFKPIDARKKIFEKIPR